MRDPTRPSLNVGGIVVFFVVFFFVSSCVNPSFYLVLLEWTNLCIRDVIVIFPDRMEGQSYEQQFAETSLGQHGCMRDSVGIFQFTKENFTRHTLPMDLKLNYELHIYRYTGGKVKMWYYY